MDHLKTHLNSYRSIANCRDLTFNDVNIYGMKESSLFTYKRSGRKNG